VTWSHVVVTLPDDGTGAMPLLRHLIVNDAKSSTYKLALLRVLCRIADGAPGVAVPAGDEHVDVPMGLVGLYWLRLFRPLLDANLPQSPTNRGTEGLGFVGAAYHRAHSLSPLDLRIGQVVGAARSGALHGALRDACDTIATMPVRYSAYPDGRRIFEVARTGTRHRPSGSWALDLPAMWSFGAMRVPAHVWQCLTRYDAWIEPALVAEWIRLMRGYAQAQGREMDDGAASVAMAWTDPARDVRDARTRALAVMEQGQLQCVWTGRRLTSSTLDIDHCFPWAVWPCDALWNLMPAHPDVNRRWKRQRIPDDARMLDARGRIEDWWSRAYRANAGTALARRFADEARATLPGLTDRDEPGLDDVFGGARLQRVRLRVNQQVAEWGL
jgi:hypothetical protein